MTYAPATCFEALQLRCHKWQVGGPDHHLLESSSSHYATSKITRRTKHVAHQNIARHTSHAIRHTPQVTSHKQKVNSHTPHVTRHTRHTSQITQVRYQMCNVTHHTRHTSHVTRHASPATHHTSHVSCYITHITSHVARYLEQMNQHGQRLLMPNACNAAAVARHVVNNLHDDVSCAAIKVKIKTEVRRMKREVYPNSSREQLHVGVLQKRNNAIEEANVAHVPERWE